MATHALILHRGLRLATPDGHQAMGFPMYADGLRAELGFTFELREALDLEATRRVLQEMDAGRFDLVIVMLHWSVTPDEAAAFMEEVRAAYPHPKLVLLDYYAPTASPHFGVLPHIDGYWKRQVLRDHGPMIQPPRGGYVFTDYLVEHMGYDIGDWGFGSPADPDHLHKVQHCWNLGVTGRYRKMLSLSRFTLPWSARPFAVCRRLGKVQRTGEREWYQQYRDACLEKLEPIAARRRCTPVGSVPSKRYYAEMAMSRVVVSPFGWGELCFRDYEAVCLGALLVKPSMEHLQTSPDIFKPGETYVPVAWDLSDLEETVEHYLAHPAEAKRIVREARRVLRGYYEAGGFVADIRRLLGPLGLVDDRHGDGSAGAA
ncbi:MAG: glycosyltransferase [Planctomycetota bacterium]